MARLILKSPYLKPASKTRAANHLRYIATREGVVKPEDPRRQLPATQYHQSHHSLPLRFRDRVDDRLVGLRQRLRIRAVPVLELL